ncbi:MAG: CpsD/CapB family tyrosine-protein kinase [Lachnospiraceae bacterium]|nr:CpsD/CapB family tyrosine-protein kinase [Lachnospiraceae bacterium]
MEQKVKMNDPRKTDFMYEEAIKTLRTNIQFTGRNVKCIVLTSCFPNEGKSDIAFQLAKEIGNIGKRVILVDADIRKSTFASRYRIGRPVKGLSHYLCGTLEADGVCYQTNYDNVDIIFAGSMVPNPSELLEEPALEELIQHLREQYDYILIDTPPIADMVDAAIVAKWCDGAILVIEERRVSYRIAQKAKKKIMQTGCKFLGAVLNKVDVKKERYYGSYGGYYGRRTAE